MTILNLEPSWYNMFNNIFHILSAAFYVPFRQVPQKSLCYTYIIEVKHSKINSLWFCWSPDVKSFLNFCFTDHFKNNNDDDAFGQPQPRTSGHGCPFLSRRIHELAFTRFKGTFRKLRASERERARENLSWQQRSSCYCFCLQKNPSDGARRGDNQKSKQNIRA
jgi:hypothetical protein